MRDEGGTATVAEHDPFAGAPLAAFAPMSESQREVWLACAMDPDLNIGFNEGINLDLSGPLDIEVLRRSLQHLIERHESLRMTFSPNGTWMCILEHLALDLPVLELADAGAFNDLCESAMRRRFDLVAGPLLNLVLVRRDPLHHNLLFVAHHLICDGWSFAVLLTELGELYSAGVDQRDARLDAAPKYTDYAMVERGFLDAAEGQEQERFWLDRLNDPPPVLDIPSDRPRPAHRRFEANRIDRPIPMALTERLRRTAPAHGASLVTLLLAGFSALLHRLSAAEDMIIGLAAAGQSFHQQGQLVGHCVNLLPLRLKPAPGVPFRDFLAQTRTVVLDAADHQGITFGALLPKIELARDDSRPPLISVLFNIDVRDDNIAHRGLQVSYSTLVRRAENFELFFNIVDDGSRLLIECAYAEARFDAADIERLLDQYLALLATACEDPSRRLHDFDLVAPEERRHLVSGLNPATVKIDTTRVPARFSAQAEAGADRIAICHRGARLTYGALEARVDAIAAALQAQGVAPGQFVAVCVERGPDLPAALLGVLRTGAAYLPLDPDFPEDRLAYMLADSNATMVVTEGALAARLGTTCRAVLLEEICAAQRPQPVAHGANDAAYMIYTSGSTGTPKGVVIGHASLCNFLDSMAREPGLGPEDALLAVTTPSFDIAGLELFLPLVQGARLVIAERDTTFDGVRLATQLHDESITVMQATPATWRILLCAGWVGRPGFRALCGGEPLPRDLAGALLPRVAQLWNLYGPTETTIWSTVWRVSTASDPIRIGKPITNTRCYVLDARGHLLPRGAVGELWIGGAGVAIGYHQREELDAERFLPDPFFSRPGARMYRTGDLARWTSSGDLECLGRSDFQVKLRGYRIELGEIEHALTALPGINECVCGVRERSPDDPHLVAWLRADPGTPIDGKDLRTALARSLPAYMLPQHFLEIAQLPRLPNGKLDRKSLPDPFVRAPAGPVFAAGVAPLAPMSPTQAIVADIWIRVLGSDRIGREDRFIDLGGHSLLAVQAAAAIHEALGVRMPLRSLMMDSLERVAARIDRQRNESGLDRAPTASIAPRVPPQVTTPAPILPLALHFGNDEQRCFGLHFPAREPIRRHAILICPSIGIEAMRSYRALSLLGRTLADAGFEVMRFDYRCTGDSAGYSGAARLEDWIDDVRLAGQHLRTLTGQTSICLLGHRLGALIATEALRRGGSAAGLLRLDAPSSGQSWLDLVHGLDAPYYVRKNHYRPRRYQLGSNESDVLGMPMDSRLVQALRATRLDPPPPVELLHDYRSLDHADGGGLSESQMQLDDAGHWQDGAWIFTHWMPATSLGQITAHLISVLA